MTQLQQRWSNNKVTPKRCTGALCGRTPTTGRFVAQTRVYTKIVPLCRPCAVNRLREERKN